MTSSEAAESPGAWRPENPEIPGWIRLLVKIWMYGRGPVVLYRRPPLSMLPTLLRMTAEDEAALPAQLREYLLITEQRLAAIGFGAVMRARSRIVPNLQACTALIEHANDATIGNIIVIRTLQLNRLKRSVSFESRFEDGKSVATTNSETSRRHPPRPFVLGVRLTEIEDPVELYDIHRFRVAERSRHIRQVPLTRGADPLAYEQAEKLRLFEHWLRAGYYRRDGEHGVRFTVRGAALSAWRGMFPWRQLSEAMRARDAARILDRYRRARGRGR